MPLRKPWHTTCPKLGEYWASLDWSSPVTDFMVTKVDANEQRVLFVVSFKGRSNMMSESGDAEWIHYFDEDWGAWIYEDGQLQCAECGEYHDGLDYLCLTCRLDPVTKRLREIMAR